MNEKTIVCAAHLRQYLDVFRQYLTGDEVVATADYELIEYLADKKLRYVNMAALSGVNRGRKYRINAAEYVKQIDDLLLGQEAGSLARALLPQWACILESVECMMHAFHSLIDTFCPHSLVVASGGDIQIAYAPLVSPTGLFNSIAAFVAYRSEVPVQFLEEISPPQFIKNFKNGIYDEVKIPLPTKHTDVFFYSPSISSHEHESFIQKLRARNELFAVLTDNPALQDGAYSGLLQFFARLPWEKKLTAESINEAAHTMFDVDPLHDYFESSFAEKLKKCLLSKLIYVSKVESWANFIPKCVSPSLAVLCWNDAAEIKVFSAALARNSVQPVVVSHAGIPIDWARFYLNGYDNSCYAVWGAYDSKFYERVACHGNQIWETGLLRRLGSCPSCEVVSDENKIAVFTARLSMPSLYISDQAYGRWREGFEQLKALAMTRKNWHFVVKPHPRYDYHSFYSDYLDLDNITVANPKQPLAASDYDIGVLFDAPSTVCTEVVQQQRPLIYLKNSLPDDLYFPVEEGGAILVRSVCEMEAEIDRLFQDDAYRKGVLEKQQAWLKRAVIATGDEAADNMDRFVRELIQKSKQSAQNNVEIDPAARWIWDMTSFLGYLQGGAKKYICEEDGPMTWGDYLRTLRDRGKLIKFDAASDYLNIRKLGVEWMRSVIWQPWRGNIAPQYPAPLPIVLWRVYCALPAELKPPRRQVRSFFLEAFVQDYRNQPGSITKRVAAKTVPFLISPGWVLSSGRS